MDPETSEVLRFGSNTTAPGPTIFQLPSAIAKETDLDNERERRAYTEALARGKNKETLQKIFFASLTLTQSHFFCVCTLNKVNGNVPVNIKKLYPFESQLKILCKTKTSNNKCRKTLCSAKGIKLLQQMSRPISFTSNANVSTIHFDSKGQLYQETVKKFGDFRGRDGE